VTQSNIKLQNIRKQTFQMCSGACKLFVFGPFFPSPHLFTMRQNHKNVLNAILLKATKSRIGFLFCSTLSVAVGKAEAKFEFKIWNDYLLCHPLTILRDRFQEIFNHVQESPTGTGGSKVRGGTVRRIIIFVFVSLQLGPHWLVLCHFYAQIFKSCCKTLQMEKNYLKFDPSITN
jgi:hypothetical protein